MLSAAGAFIVEDLGPGGRSVYRPFHDLLAAHLRGESAVDGTDVDSANGDIGQQRKVRTEQAITHALLATVPTGEGIGGIGSQPIPTYAHISPNTRQLPNLLPFPSWYRTSTSLLRPTRSR